MKSKKTTESYFAFGQHWIKLREYVWYRPVDGKDWQSIKDDFYIHRKYNHENPLFITIKKDNATIGVWVYGFILSDSPSKIDQTNIGNVVLCKILATKEYIAIAW